MKTIQEIETRLAEIKNELDKPEADLDALQEEVRSLNEQKAQLATCTGYTDWGDVNG